MKAYIYQGTNLIGLDDTGLSDPYVVIRICDKMAKGPVKEQTNNPSWKTTITIKNIIIYGSIENIVHSPPEIIVDLYDEDFFLMVKSKSINLLIRIKKFFF